jgi:hypothetical protein
MIAMPAAAALAGLRRFPALLLLIALVFFVMIGWRYEVGYDWKNYVRLLAYAGPNTVGPPLPQSETGFELLLVMTKAFGVGCGSGSPVEFSVKSLLSPY